VTQTIEKLQATILFAGNSGDGMQLSGNQFTNTVAQLGNDVNTLPDFPAEIRAPEGTVAGISGFQLHFGSIDINSPGDKCDVLIAMNAAALKKNIKSLKSGGIIIANTDGFDNKNLRLAKIDHNPLENLQTKFKIFSIDITKQTLNALKDFDLSTKDKDRSKNMFALGIVYWMYSKPLDFTIEFLNQKFSNNEKTRLANINVLKAGYNYSEITELITEKYSIQKAKMPAGNYRNISGNEALTLGLITASLKVNKELFFAGYPITPASDILHNLAKQKHFGVKTFQAEDEIAAITSAIGASFAGSLAVTASSGPGIALKTEAMGLAFIQEIPLIIINVQRGGPSTGLPTKTEQADLLQAIFGRNGEAPIPVLAAKSPVHCFEIAFEAAKIALEFNTPIIVLSDGYIANGSEPWKYPTIEEMPEIFPQIVSEKEKDNYLPYKRNENFVRKIAFAGMKGFEHRLGGLEKENETGNVSYDAENHHKMVKLRQKKIEAIAKFYPELQLDSGTKDAKILIISWGSTYGAVKTTMQKLLSENKSFAHLHLTNMFPLHNDINNFTKSFSTILIPELNNGQLIKILHEKLQRELIGINYIKGMPFLSDELYLEFTKFV